METTTLSGSPDDVVDNIDIPAPNNKTNAIILTIIPVALNFPFIFAFSILRPPLNFTGKI